MVSPSGQPEVLPRCPCGERGLAQGCYGGAVPSGICLPGVFMHVWIAGRLRLDNGTAAALPRSPRCYERNGKCLGAIQQEGAIFGGGTGGAAEREMRMPGGMAVVVVAVTTGIPAG